MFRPHAHEQDRLDSLRSYRILDTAPEPSYDAITRLAATICNTPVALISLVDEDRQWFKSRIGMDSTGTARELSFCSDAVAADAALVPAVSSVEGRLTHAGTAEAFPDIAFAEVSSFLG